MDALWSRGVSNDQIADFAIGYIDGELPSDVEYPSEFRKWSGDGSKLEDSFVLPLTNWVGETKGIQFRSVKQEIKGYMDFFTTRSEPVLFGLAQAAVHVWRTRSITTVEGAFDLFPVQRAVPGVVATITGKINNQFLRSIRRVADTIYIFYDDDPLGRKASWEFKKEHGGELNVRIIEYPSGVLRWDGKRVKDPGELWESWGDDRLTAFLQSQVG